MDSDKKLVGVRSRHNNGNFKEDFLALGYPCMWLTSEYRYLPMELIKRLQSDADLVFLDPSELEGLHESHLPYPPAIPKNFTEQRAEVAARMEGEPLIPAMSLKTHSDGEAVLEWTVLNYPSIWQEGEIRELPQSTINRLMECGYKISIDITEAPGQGVFKLAVKNWREEKANKDKIRNALFRAEAVHEIERRERLHI